MFNVGQTLVFIFTLDLMPTSYSTFECSHYWVLCCCCCCCCCFREGWQWLGVEAIAVVQEWEGIRRSDEEAAEAVQAPRHGRREQLATMHYLRLNTSYHWPNVGRHSVQVPSASWVICDAWTGRGSRRPGAPPGGAAAGAPGRTDEQEPGDG